jgi:hypothetical protein
MMKIEVINQTKNRQSFKSSWNVSMNNNKVEPYHFLESSRTS